jgi:hypothetical protein
VLQTPAATVLPGSCSQNQEKVSAMSVTSDVADLATKFRQATAELTIRNVSQAGLRQHLSDAAGPLGLSVYVGTIANVGLNSGGGDQVQFDDPATNTGYVSEWPQWAFGLAQAALLAGKEVLLVANGDPFGSNLLNVLILS